MATRRAILKTGAAAIVIVGAGAGAWALTRAPKAARAPWREAETGFGDPRLDALAYAVLAPNPHNMQPWKIRLEDDDAFSVFCDTGRLLPETDPPARQITIGFGCFLELVSQAAAAAGRRAEIDYFPLGEPWPTLDDSPVAHVRLPPSSSAPGEPLFEWALERRTNRAPFDIDRSVEQSHLDAIVAASVPGVDADASNARGRVAELRTLTAEAWATEWSNEATRRESIAVTRIGKREINEEPWGLSLAGPLLEGLGAAGVITRENMDAAGTTAYDQSMAFYDAACRTATAFVWTTTATNTRRDQLQSGRAWVRMHLAANRAGVSFHPLSQALQEFPAMAPHYERAHALLAGGEGRTVQMLARLGYAKSPPPAPREALESKLVES